MYGDNQADDRAPRRLRPGRREDRGLPRRHPPARARPAPYTGIIRPQRVRRGDYGRREDRGRFTFFLTREASPSWRTIWPAQDHVARTNTASSRERRTLTFWPTMTLAKGRA